jgi:hypothetical protein
VIFRWEVAGTSISIVNVINVLQGGIVGGAQLSILNLEAVIYGIVSKLDAARVEVLQDNRPRAYFGARASQMVTVAC